MAGGDEVKWVPIPEAVSCPSQDGTLEHRLQCRSHGRHFLSFSDFVLCLFTSLINLTESEVTSPDAFGGQQSKQWTQWAGPPGRHLTRGERQATPQSRLISTFSSISSDVARGALSLENTAGIVKGNVSRSNENHLITDQAQWSSA